MAPTKPDARNAPQKGQKNPKANQSNKVQRAVTKCKFCGKAGHSPAKCWLRAKDDGDPVLENSAEFWRNKRDNYLAMAKAKDVEISKLKAEHDRLCKEAADAEKKALVAEKDAANKSNATEAAYMKYLQEET